MAEQGGMGLGIGDFDNDGHLDIFKTHFSADTHALYKNNGRQISRRPRGPDWRSDTLCRLGRGDSGFR